MTEHGTHDRDVSDSADRRAQRTQARAAVELRRSIAAELTARGRSVREIAAYLEQQGHVNPATGEPWGKTTIGRDVQALAKEWQASAAAKTDEHRARILASLRAVERAGWDAGDLPVVLKALKQQSELLGLDEGDRVDITWKIVEMARELGIPEAEAQRIAKDLIGAIDGKS